ncbi:MAG: DNA repair protein RecO [Pseudomonadota bacterium]
MDWRDQGILLTVRRHGESAAIVDVFTREHGRHAGVVRGGASRRMAATLQPGAQLSVEWRARLEEHLGAYAVDLITSRAGLLMADPAALAGFNSFVALTSAYLAEREPHPSLYDASMGLLDALTTDEAWIAGYVGWELALLAELGFPLDLSRCASTGATEDLIWVSPKSGRAVSREAGAPYADRLLSLPAFLGGEGGGAQEGLALTGHFLRAWAAPAFGAAAPPEARDRLVETVRRQAARKEEAV